MNAKDRAYYLRRILQEQEAASAAASAEARERHEELAEAYQLRCRLDALSIDRPQPEPSRAVDYAA
jgi:hypothetical protein